MKKIVSISLVFALIAGAAFAVDLGGTVFGHVNLIEGSTVEDSDMGASGGMDRIRLEGAGEAGDVFGGWIRVEGGGSIGFDEENEVFSFNTGFQGIAWWKPIDQFKISIGGNSDGIWGKEGVTGWMFNQMPYDSSIASGSGNIWGWGESVNGALQTRFAFFGGYGDNRLALEIKPLDILGINISIPYMRGGTAEDVYKAMIAQVDLNLDFGNIAITFNGDGPFGSGAVFAYFGGTFGDLGLDVGISFHFDYFDSGDGALFAGLGLKYAADAFGIKFRTIVGLPPNDDNPLNMLFDLLPYYALSDNISAFLNMGIGITAPAANAPDGAESIVGWFINPYLRVGAEWGPSFYAGVKISSDGKDYAGDKVINFSVPISLMVSF